MSAEKTISIAGENALIVYFADKPSAAISTEIATTVKKLQTYLGATLIDLVPSYASLLVIFDPFKTDHQSVRRAINTAIKKINSTPKTSSGSLVTLPVYYSSESGPDLQRVADTAGLSVQPRLSPFISKANTASTQLALRRALPISAKSIRV